MESRAFTVQSYLFQAMGQNDTRWNTWEKGWAKLSEQKQDAKRNEWVKRLLGSTISCILNIRETISVPMNVTLVNEARWHEPKTYSLFG